MFIDGMEYEVLDVIENITIADSFIKGGNKIGIGHGEAKLYVGQISDNFTIPFFNLDNPTNIINSFILKQDLIRYLYDIQDEYKHPTQNYLNSVQLPSLWQERLNAIFALSNNILHFSLRYLNELQPPRIYLNCVNNGDKYYSLIREISLPNLSYMSCLKLRRTSDGLIFFYFKIFANLDYLQNINEVDAVMQDSTAIARVRLGQARYRASLLKECPFCPITMVNYDRLLIASHIKPYACCNDIEKYDPKNGLMLTPTIDKLFDKGFISFSDDKKILLSPWISRHTFNCLNLIPNRIYNALPFDAQRLEYIRYHRESIFKA
ncbi:HNH endonuclease [Campylobacter concisus]|uniref:HNH endonuclease n=1 Tax=Campylobacter concisus TaxID=199 RepID=UPI00122D37E9|nr:HNH endonuclease [Campylobacter concisus]